MLTQHEIFVLATLMTIFPAVWLRLSGVRGPDLYIGAFFVTGVNMTGLLTVLELVFWLVGPLKRG